MLLAGAGTLLATLVALQTANTGYNMRQVLAHRPAHAVARHSDDAQEMAFYQEVTRRVAALPGVEGVALGKLRAVARRRHACARGSQFAAEGYTPADGEENPRARLRIVAPGFFAVLGVPMLAGRDFTSDDRRGSEPVVIVSQSVAQRLFPNGDAVNRKIWWTDPLFGKPLPRRIVGVVADVDDENIVRGPALTIYHPVQQMGARRPAVRARRPAIRTRWCRRSRGSSAQLSANQPVERAATLEDVRAEVLAPERLNAFVLSGFAGVALLIAVVGVAGVLAFSVSARTREFGVRLAIGSTPRHLLLGVLSEGARHRRRSGSSRAWRAAMSFGRVAAELLRERARCRAPCRSWARQRCSSAPPSSRR